MRLIKLAGLFVLAAFVTLALAGKQLLRPAVAAQAQSFDLCLEDDNEKGNAIKINTSNGQYQLCAGGAALSGTGSVTKMGDGLSFAHSADDRRVTARVDNTAHSGSAVIQTPPGKIKGTIRDSNTANSRCACR